MSYDYLIVGSGLYGSTFAYLLKQNGYTPLVIEKRSHLGGNIYCENLNNINIHKYGAHIFHTSDKEVWDFVNKFVKFNQFINSPIANYNGQLFNLPFNMNTFYQMWGVTKPSEAISKIEDQKKKSNISIPTNLEEQAISLVGKDIYDKLIKEYTEKQWGRDCKSLPTFIIKRIPVRFNFNNNYFDDTYQGIPIGGYNKLIQGLLSGIETRTNTDFFKNRSEWEKIASKIIFTGKIDQFFDYKYGKLEYRTVKFETEKYDISNYQGNAVINYTSRKEPYTRIIEHKHFEPENPHYNDNITYISKEYSTEWNEGMECYYPINDNKNMKILTQYNELSKNFKNVIFGGRLAEYKYYDMDDIISKVFNDAKKEFN